MAHFEVSGIEDIIVTEGQMQSGCHKVKVENGSNRCVGRWVLEQSEGKLEFGLS